MAVKTHRARHHNKGQRRSRMVKPDRMGLGNVKPYHSKDVMDNTGSIRKAPGFGHDGLYVWSNKPASLVYGKEW